MEEIEVKILEVEPAKIVERLKELGAKKIFDGEIVASYLDFADRSMANQEKMLRLRKKDKAVELTFKTEISKEEAKVMKELEVYVDDFTTMKKIFESIGLQEYAQARKHRTSFELNGVRFEIDKFPNVPPFLEIEAPTLEKLKAAVIDVGYSMEDTKAWSGGDVLKHYGVKK